MNKQFSETNLSSFFENKILDKSEVLDVDDLKKFSEVDQFIDDPLDTNFERKHHTNVFKRHRTPKSQHKYRFKIYKYTKKKSNDILKYLDKDKNELIRHYDSNLDDLGFLINSNKSLNKFRLPDSYINHNFVRGTISYEHDPCDFGLVNTVVFFIKNVYNMKKSGMFCIHAQIGEGKSVETGWYDNTKTSDLNVSFKFTNFYDLNSLLEIKFWFRRRLRENVLAEKLMIPLKEVILKSDKDKMGISNYAHYRYTNTDGELDIKKKCKKKPFQINYEILITLVENYSRKSELQIINQKC